MKNLLNVHVRSVWEVNIEYEFSIIRSLINRYSYVAIDTEFPGVIFKSKINPRCLSSEKRYALMKMNVDNLRLIQVGLTFSDAEGRLPDLGMNGDAHFVWEFNFRNFDPRFHAHNTDSINLLQNQGINFQALCTQGINPLHFRALLLSSGLLCNPNVTWITFHSASDFAYVIKAITLVDLPAQMKDFLLLLNRFFGSRVYDVKHMIKFCDGLYGGLERVAAQLQVERMAGKGHQAGSDSLLMLQIFLRMKQVCFSANSTRMEKHMGVIYDLELDASYCTTRRPVRNCFLRGGEPSRCSTELFCTATSIPESFNSTPSQLPSFMTQQLSILTSSFPSLLN